MRLTLLFLLVLNCNLVSSQVKTPFDTLPRYIHFSPSTFYNAYNAKALPVLNIRPGDTVNTESLDALGFDKDSIKKGNRGNPLTGPFFIEGSICW